MRLGLRLARAALSCAFVIAGSSSARAAPSGSPSIDEALESPDSDPCLTRASLVGGISRWLERDDVGGMLRVRVHGSSKSEVRFEIVREGSTVARVFDARTMSCEALRGVVTFSIAIAIESALREARAEAQSKELTAEMEPEIPPSIAAPKPSGTRTLTNDAPKPRKTGSLRVSLEEVVLVGNPPGVSLGAELGFARRFESGWELAAGALQTTGSATFTLGDETARTWLTTGRARACRELPTPWRTLHLALCAGGGAGSLSMRGYGPSGRSASLFWGALYLRGEAELPITSHLSLRFGLAPEVVVARPSLVIVETGTGRPRHRLTTQATAFALSAGLVLSF